MLGRVLAPDFCSRFQDRDPYRVFFDRFDGSARFQGQEPTKQILYVWLKSIFVNYLLAADRMDLAHGVEVRLPFLDHRLFEYASQIPVSLLAKNDQSKYILRQATRPFITDSTYRRVKKPFLAPPSTMRVGSQFYELIQDILRSRQLQVPFFDQKAVTELLDQMPSRSDLERAALDPVVLVMASMAVLHNRYRL